MSDCNYCTLRAIKMAASLSHGKVILELNTQDGLWLDGVDVFIHYPKDEKPTWAAWFMKLTDHCVC
jgi:hypothetical protein